MRKISPKAILYAVFYTALAAVLSACVVDPLSLAEFVANEKVMEIIEKGNIPYQPGPAEARVATVTFTLTDQGANVSLSPTATIAKSALESGGSLTLTVDTSSIAGTVTVQLLVNGKTVNASTITIKYGGTPDIDEILVVGSFDITVVVTVGGVEYSNTFTVTIS
jgi:hypothetical protein